MDGVERDRGNDTGCASLRPRTSPQEEDRDADDEHGRRDEHDDEPAAGPILQPPDAVVRHDDLRSPSRMKSSPTSAYSTQQAAAPMAAQESCGLKLPSSASPARIASPKTIIQ